MKHIIKIAGLTCLFLALMFGGYMFWGSQNVGHGDNLIDDSDREVPFFRVMSTMDTTLIDPKIHIYYQEIINDKYRLLSSRTYESRMRDVCKHYDDICDRMKIEGDFSLRELYVFTVFTVYLIDQIDDHTLLEGISGLRTTLACIIFDKSSDDITRGKAGHRNVLINTYDMRSVIELFEVMTHELMHIFDLGVLDDKLSTQKSSQYKEFGRKSFGINDWSLRFYALSWQSTNKKRNSTREHNIISGYGHTNAIEEFAEFGNAWINHQVPLLAIAREDPHLLQKYLLFKQLFGERFINKDIDTYRNKNLEERPYDTSRWHDTVSNK